MKNILLFTLSFFASFVVAQTKFSIPPEAKIQDGVPQGVVTEHTFDQSTIFPGTTRTYWVYVPAQYDATKPACLMVFQDGRASVNRERGERMPTVFDNLIHAGEMPVTIGVFVNPGEVPPAHDNALTRYNRSYEYDGLGDHYARFLIEELLPVVGKEYRISQDPNDRAIYGASSGAICAFTAAWERPDSFSRVGSLIGTYVGLRGGDEIASLIRKVEPKPLRIFLQDGSADLNIYAGDWWMANQTMQRALEWAGYEHTYVWGEGGHGRQHGASIAPDLLRWLWKDWPKPVTTHPENSKHRLNEFVEPDSDWELVAEGFGFTEGPAVDDAGQLFFTDLQKSIIHRVDTSGELTTFATQTGRANGLMFGPDGWLYACAGGAKKIVAYTPEGTQKVIAENMGSNDLCINASGTIYFTDPGGKKIWMIPTGGPPEVVDNNFQGCNGILLSTDQSLLYVADYSGRMLYSYQLDGEGKPQFKQPYGYLHLPPKESRSYADGMTTDTEGWLYVATKMGIQILDQPGRVNLILPSPEGVRHPSNVIFGGPEMKTLYATCGDKVYKRVMKKTGVASRKAPVKPKKPRL